MTTYITIPDSDIDSDSPITTELLTALRDNVAATMEKVSGAPRLATNYVTADMIASQAVRENLVQNLTYGTGYWLGSAISIASTDSTSYTKIVEFIAGQSGTIHVQFSIRATVPYSAVTVYGRIYRNGAAVGTQRSKTGVTYVAYSESISI